MISKLKDNCVLDTHRIPKCSICVYAVRSDDRMLPDKGVVLKTHQSCLYLCHFLHLSLPFFQTAECRWACAMHCRTLDTGSTLGPLDYSVLLQSTVPFGLGLDLNLEKDFESIMIWALFCNNRPSSHWHFPSLPPMTYLFTCRDGMHMSKAYSRDGSRQSPTRSLSALEPTWNTMRFKPHFKRNLSLFQTNCRALYCDVKGWQCKPSAEFKRRAQSWSFPGRGDSDSKEAAPSSRAQPSHQ